jgi:hypothetical protein
MIRALKAICTGNLLLAIALVAVYIGCGLLAGLPIDQHFLSSSPGRVLGRGSGPKVSPCAFVAFIETAILATYIVGRVAKWNLAAHRLICLLLGLVFLYMLMLQHLPHYNPFGDEPAQPAVPAGISWFDETLAWYVWASHLLYGLIGPNDERTEDAASI